MPLFVAEGLLQGSALEGSLPQSKDQTNCERYDAYEERTQIRQLRGQIEKILFHRLITDYPCFYRSLTFSRRTPNTNSAAPMKNVYSKSCQV